MPYFANSPEASIGRADSKNPATTCKGITASGRPCRRALGASSVGNSPNGKGVLAVLSHAVGLDQDPAAFYCYQHKDQAPAGSTIAQADFLSSNNSHSYGHGHGHGHGASAAPQPALDNRNSIDTLMGRLGVLDIQDETPTKPRRKKDRQNMPPEARPAKRTTLPQQWQEVPGPLLSVPTDSIPQGAAGTQQQQQNASSGPAARPNRPSPQRRRSEYHFSFFCCGSKPDKEHLTAARPRPQQQQHQRPTPMSQRPSKQQQQQQQQQGGTSPLPPSTTQRPSQTALLKAWIPDSVAPATHSALMTELSKPLSQQDRDDGYIYMFWETPTSGPQPTRELTRSLMHDAHDAWEHRSDLLADPWQVARRLGSAGNAALSTSDALRAAARLDERIRRSSNGGSGGTSSPVAVAAATTGPTANPDGSMMLKIGRADNVQRRMDQWTRQCGRNITLLRYYPYVSGGGSGSPAHSPGASPARRNGGRGGGGGSGSGGDRHPGPVPNCARVERLIHVELAAQRVMKQCDACGRQHREWFAVEPTRQGVQAVDETIRRWVRWGWAERAREEEGK